MNFDRIQKLIKELEAECATIKEQARTEGFRHCCIDVKFNGIVEKKPQISVWLSSDDDRRGESLSAPTVEAAYEELKRRLNWERDINMTLIGHD